MQTITRPPQVRYGARPLFTLHNSKNTIMSWCTPESKMAIIAFKRERDAQLFGKTVESDFLTNKKWPNFQKLNFNPGVQIKEMTLITPVTWSDEDSLKEFCVKYYFDMIIINYISNTFKINGTVFQFEIPESFHLPYLEELLLRDSS